MTNLKRTSLENSNSEIDQKWLLGQCEFTGAPLYGHRKGLVEARGRSDKFEARRPEVKNLQCDFCELAVVRLSQELASNKDLKREISLLNERIKRLEAILGASSLKTPQTNGSKEPTRNEVQSTAQPKQVTISNGHGHFNGEELLRATQKRVRVGNSAKPQLDIRSNAQLKLGAAKPGCPKMPRPQVSCKTYKPKPMTAEARKEIFEADNFEFERASYMMLKMKGMPNMRISEMKSLIHENTGLRRSVFGGLAYIPEGKCWVVCVNSKEAKLLEGISKFERFTQEEISAFMPHLISLAKKRNGTLKAMNNPHFKLFTRIEKDALKGDQSPNLEACGVEVIELCHDVPLEKDQSLRSVLWRGPS